MLLLVCTVAIDTGIAMATGIAWAIDTGITMATGLV